MIEAFCYLPIDPRNPTGRDRLKEQLALEGFVVRAKVGTTAGDGYKCDFDVEMTMEMVRIAHEIRPDIVVLCSGDSDFAPVIEYLRAKGIRAEVASFSNAASRTIILKSSSFINLDKFFLREGEQGVQMEPPDAEGPVVEKAAPGG